MSTVHSILLPNGKLNTDSARQMLCCCTKK